jgi:outer membrane protein assembly factor BamB
LGDPLMAQPAVSDQRVYAAYPAPDGGHRLAAFALADGDPMWEAVLDGDLISAPVVHAGFVYGTSFSGTVYKIDASTGLQEWARPMRATSAPWIAEERVYVAQRAAGATPVEGISSLSESGETVTSMRAPSRARYLDPRVQSRTEYSRVSHLDDTSVGFASTPASAKVHRASVNVGHGSVRALWEFQGSRPTVVGGSVYTTQGSVVRALDRESDRVRWQSRLPGDERAGGHVGTPPACAGGRLYFGSIAGEISVLEAESGTVLGTHVVGEPVRSQPVVQRGRLFVATTAGSLVCIELNDESANGWPMWGGSAAHNGPLHAGK